MQRYSIKYKGKLLKNVIQVEGNKPVLSSPGSDAPVSDEQIQEGFHFFRQGLTDPKWHFVLFQPKLHQVDPDSSLLYTTGAQYLCVRKDDHCFVSYVRQYVAKHGLYVDDVAGRQIYDVTELQALYRIEL